MREQMRLLREWLLEWPCEDLPAGPQKAEKKTKRPSHHGTEEVTAQVGNQLWVFSFKMSLNLILESNMNPIHEKLVDLKTSLIFFKQINCFQKNHWPGATSVGEVIEAQDQDSRQPEGEPGEERKSRAAEEKPQGAGAVGVKVEARLK